MNSILKKDFRRLMLDAGKVQECVETLEQEENSVRAGGRAQSDLTQLASRIVYLEFDLRAILLDCVVLGRHYWKRHNLPLILSLHSALGVTHDDARLVAVQQPVVVRTLQGQAPAPGDDEGDDGTDEDRTT